MKLRKIFALMVCAALILGGCGGTAGAPAENKSTENTAAVSQTSADNSQAESETAEASVPEEKPAAAQSTASTSEGSSDAAKEASSESSEAAAAESSASSGTSDSSAADASPEDGKLPENINPPEIPGLTYESYMPLEYAECFEVYYYNDGYKVIDVPQIGQYLIVPEGKTAPDGLDPKMYVIQQPLSEVYMAATGSVSFFDELGAMDVLTMSSLEEDGWVIEAPIKAMQEGKMVYAGKYSAPDYEMIVGRGCQIAIESTMILHSPEVQEMIEDLGIPVFIDRCSYELDAFGRIEWIKAYGAMLNLEDVAEERFRNQEAVLADLKDFENTGKTVAFFAVNSNKTVTVRKTEDFIPNMIELAGGKYIFDDLKNPDSTSASVRLSMEEFYSTAVKADYLIYNGTIENPITSIDELIGKNELFKEFKAVKEKNVWVVDKRWYQSTATVGYLITDLNLMLTGGDPKDMVFLSKVD